MRHHLPRAFAALACLMPLLALPASPSARDPQVSSRVEVESFTPEGYVRQVRQVTVRFTVPMVALGDPRLADPLTVDCDATGKGRWADPRNWVYDFDNDLDAGLSCRFALRPGLRSLEGIAVRGRSTFSFNTGGPAIIASLPRDGWEELDEDQVFLLRLDAPATAASVEANAYCAIEGVVERIPVQVLTGEERRKVLDQRKALGYDYLQLLWKNGEVSDVRVRNRAMEPRDELIVALRCQRRFPPATRVLLRWGAGVTTTSGIATQADQQLAFRVRPPFIAQVECTRANSHAGCMPILPLEVTFSAPVEREQALAIRLRSGGGRMLTPTTPEAHAPTVEKVTFAGPFPPAAEVTVILPASLADDAGRPLENAARFPLAVRIDAYPPLVKFSGNFGILESSEGGVLPVTLRNVEATLPARQSSISARLLRVDRDPGKIAEWLARVEEAAARSGFLAKAEPAFTGVLKEDEPQESGARPRRVWRDTTGSRSVFGSSDATVAFSVSKPLRAAAEEVVGIPLKEPGFYVIELESRALGAALLGRDETRYVATSALVTDLAVHFKWGRESSLAWVTRLSTAAPVAGAEVSVSDYCGGRLLWKGRTDEHGRARIDRSLGEPSSAGGGCRWRHPLMVLAAKDADFSLTVTNWDQGITPYEFGLPVGSEFAAGIYHTVLDRSLFRAGETVSMKHFLRQHVSHGLTVPAPAGSHRIAISHQGSGQHYSMDADFDANGIAIGEWKIPAEARLGTYVVTIDDHPSAEFKVEQFRLPTMRASVSSPARVLVAPRNVTLDLHVAYLAGGGASGLPVKLRTFVEPRPLQLADYPDYQFGGAPVQQGIVTQGVGAADYDFESQSEKETTRTRTVPLALDASGSARVTVTDVPALDGPGRLIAELEYADANGETLTTTGYVSLAPATLSVGIRREGWVGTAKQLRFRVVALNLDGKPQAGQAITVSLYQSNAYSYRKRLIGGFYSYETTRETKKLDAGCSGVTNAEGLLACEVAPGSAGQIVVRAEARDSAGALAGATTSMWVVDEDAWWFGGTSGDRMDVLPERKEYEAGDKARFQVRMPFRNATALVTVEREGVLSSFVTELHGNAPIVEVPIAATYSPNVFVSVLAIRGRVAHGDNPAAKLPAAREVTALVDLTKPAYRLGTAQIRVGWRPHRLDVAVHPERTTYRVRDRVAVKIQVATADGSALPPGSEVAIAAVDEALLDLAPNASWELLEAMMGQRGLEVWTSTAQMQVVGKRHYGRKAIPHGGGGGREPDKARELFDSLLYWQPRTVLDEHGEASISIPLNDSLSAFRIVAVAHGGAERFGSGAATINTTQDLILLSGLPPLVREGDRYAATVTVRNTTDHGLSAQVEIAGSGIREALAAEQLEIPAGQSRDLTWSVTAPVGERRIDWNITARAAGTTGDHLKVSETVLAAYPVRTYQATIAQLTKPLAIPAQIPRGAVPGRGGLEITLRAQLGDGALDGVREYMGFYPYICLEQLASRAIALDSRNDWDALVQRLPAYTDADGLLKYFPSDRLQGDDGLTAYFLAIAHEAGWPVGEDRDQMLAALTRFVEGKLTRDSALPTADLAIRKLQAIDALSRYGAARPDMLDSITVEPNLLPTSALLDWIGILRRVPGIADADTRTREALGLLRARLNFQGTVMGFSSERTDALWWLMISGDSNANRMLLTVLDRPEWREDIPRLVRGALARQQFGHWNTTVANAWGVLALQKFSAAFEATAVRGSTTLHYGKDEHVVTWPQPPDTPPDMPPNTPINTPPESFPWHSTLDTLEITHAGSGAPWAMVRATAALPLTKPLSSGFKVTRTITPVEQRQSGVWTRGDVARVHLQLEAQSDMSWVVVDDPIPAGASVLGSGLGGQSELLQRDEQRSGWAWLAFEERRFDAYRAYYRFVPKGHWTVDYTVRLNNPGTFQLPATRVEAMYAPEMLGEAPNAPVTVQPAVTVNSGQSP